jgi:hypothetical protein
MAEDVDFSGWELPPLERDPGRRRRSGRCTAGCRSSVWRRRRRGRLRFSAPQGDPRQGTSGTQTPSRLAGKAKPERDHHLDQPARPRIHQPSTPTLESPRRIRRNSIRSLSAASSVDENRPSSSDSPRTRSSPGATQDLAHRLAQAAPAHRRHDAATRADHPDPAHPGSRARNARQSMAHRHDAQSDSYPRFARGASYFPAAKYSGGIVASNPRATAARAAIGPTRFPVPL